jgi:modification methylase
LHFLQKGRSATAVLRSGTNLEHDGRSFTALSALGSYVAGGTSINGWKYWGVEREGKLVSLETIRDDYLRQHPPSRG